MSRVECRQGQIWRYCDIDRGLDYSVMLLVRSEGSSSVWKTVLVAGPSFPLTTDRLTTPYSDNMALQNWSLVADVEPALLPPE